MDYVIKNNKNLFIRLDDKGKPVTCGKKDKMLFEYSKAKNIAENLPKTLRRLRFRVEAVPDIKPKEETGNKTEQRTIESGNYVVPDQIKQWVEKFGICDDIWKEAQKRKDELNKKLSEVDKDFINMIHEIEFEGRIDLYGGWLERNRVKENREKRRRIKDELFVISKVLKMDVRSFDRKAIDRIVSGLSKRKFRYRIIEEEENEMQVL